MAEASRKTARLGSFLVRDKIGEGPRATVFSAEAQGVTCALKILKDSLLPGNLSHRRKFLQILRRLPSIEHHSVVKVLEAGEEDGRFYVAMELMQCPTLAQLLARDQRLLQRDVIMYARQIAQALQAGRDVNLYHGDLTLSNVFVVASNRVKVGDFAIKKYLAQEPRDTHLREKREAAEQENAEEEWATAEDLLRARSESIVTLDLQEDLASLAIVILKLLGCSVPEQEAEEPFQDFRERLREMHQGLSLAGAEVNPHLADVIRRLLTPGGFRAPGDVVVDLASAMVFQRLSGGAAAASPSQETKLYRPDSVPPARPAVQPRAEPAPAELPAAEALTKEAQPKPGEEMLAERPAAEIAAPEATPLFVWHGDSRGEFFVLREGEQLVLGRDPDQCHFTIPEALVSRKHCILLKKNGEIWVRDANSSNGTFVNEQRVQSARLSAGDVVRIGSCRISVAVSFPK